MSAFMVSKAHIDAMILAGIAFNPTMPAACWPGRSTSGMPLNMRLDSTTATATGKMLWQANLDSVNARYPDPGHDGHALAIAAYRFDFGSHWHTRVDPVVILSAIACYEYQSCEHEAWETSEARAFCESLRALMITKLPGYDSAPWGIEDLKQVAARKVA